MKNSAQKKGSVFGGILLLAGSCIGAGMLALPIVTGLGGFGPSMALFFFAWLFMTTTGFLLMEVNLTLGHNLSLVSLAEKSLGPIGRILTWLLFLFLFYSLGIAYIAASGSILQSITLDLTGIYLAAWVYSLFFTLIFGAVLMVGVLQVDYLNRLLMVGLVVSYLILIFLGAQHVDLELLARSHWRYAFAALPVLIISFGFHNMIPSLAMYLEGDVKRLRITILCGSLIPLVIYFLWQYVMLGIIPVERIAPALEEGETATSILRLVVGKSWINMVGQSFALFAIVTSFLAQSLSLVDFLADGLKVPKKGVGRFLLVFLTLAPPFMLAYLYPSIFLHALNLAGGISAVILFGVMPALMVWILRYKKKISLSPLLPAGRVLLTVVLIVAFAIFALELAQELGWSLIPKEAEVL
ncbi:MAG: Tyrosine-specific transport protein [Chlamydiales bacterium]|nr:Tyrosine-specific transport protein [Chlamydiales bacterium]MCH9635122.1 Tyrosine-specific transport protein [Chlamydiales bacterium]MCH9703587.1 tyrosine transporter [Chlamydiota bacterium]